VFSASNVSYIKLRSEPGFSQLNDCHETHQGMQCDRAWSKKMQRETIQTLFPPPNTVFEQQNPSRNVYCNAKRFTIQNNTGNFTLHWPDVQEYLEGVSPSWFSAPSGVGVSRVPAYRLGNAGGVRKWRRCFPGMVCCLTVQTLRRAHAKTFGNL